VSVRLPVRLSVPAWAHSSKPVAAGLLLWARRAGDIDRLLHGQSSAAAALECGQCHGQTCQVSRISRETHAFSMSLTLSLRTVEISRIFLLNEKQYF